MVKAKKAVVKSCDTLDKFLSLPQIERAVGRSYLPYGKKGTQIYFF